MQRVKIILGIAVLVLLVTTTWQVAGAYYGNAELNEDLRDIAADIGTRVGLSQPPSDDDLHRYVIEKAAVHDIQLQPNQITVKVTGEGRTAVISLAVDYTSRINLFVYSFNLHFTASNAK